MPSSRYVTAGWGHPPIIPRCDPLAKYSKLLTKEPRWLAERPGMRRRMPEPVQSWVYEPGSLTARLRGCHGDKVAVNVLSQHWSKPMPSEGRLLQQPAWRYALIREVKLHADGMPLLLARTVIPTKTLEAHAELSRLGARPLGGVLFRHPEWERWQMDVVKTAPDGFTPLAIGLAGIDRAIWGRRAVYALAGRELLVCEWFLPQVFEPLHPL